MILDEVHPATDRLEEEVTGDQEGTTGMPGASGAQQRLVGSTNRRKRLPLELVLLMMAEEGMARRTLLRINAEVWHSFQPQLVIPGLRLSGVSISF